MYDKEHFNTFELLKSDDKEFYYQGHNRIYQYLFILMTVIISFKIFFVYVSKKSIFKYYTLIFIGILILQVINSYMVFLLNNNNFNLLFFYLINFLLILFFCFTIFNLNENN